MAIFGKARALTIEERFCFGRGDGSIPPHHPSFQAALDLLHWVAGVSYWKIACRGEVRFAAGSPDAFQADALARVYQHGLAELAWRNQLEGRYWPEFEAADKPVPEHARALGLANRALVPMGGGKDSLVALERVRALGITAETVQVGSAPLIGRVAERAGTRHHVIRRTLAPELAAMNAAGALNGHVPITAINAAALVVAALLWDFDAVVFANERSADAPTLMTPNGQSVNHQFAKSFAFEQLLTWWIQRYIADDLSVFSLLRRDSELGICREFAGLTEYHDVFSSCNRNFHLEGPRTSRWCGECPKCRFVFLAWRLSWTSSACGRSSVATCWRRPHRVTGLRRFWSWTARGRSSALGRPGGPCCPGRAHRRFALARSCRGRDLAQRLRGIRLPDLATVIRADGPALIPERFRS